MDQRRDERPPHTFHHRSNRSHKVAFFHLGVPAKNTQLAAFGRAFTSLTWVLFSRLAKEKYAHE